MRRKVLAILLMVVYFVASTASLAQATDILVTSTVNVSATVPGPDDGSSTSTPPSSTSTSSGGGGGGGSILPAVATQVVLSGVAYPLARVTVLKNGVLTNVSYADIDAKFSVNLFNLEAGWFNFVLYANDSDGNQSAAYSLPIYVTSGAITTANGIMLAPTLRLDSAQFNQGQVVNISGQTAPTASLVISVKAASENNFTVLADQRGWYYYKLETTNLDLALYQVKARSSYKKMTSPESLAASFLLLAKNEKLPVEEKPSNACRIRADLNSDCKVNLVDFSILAYWYKRVGVPARLDLQKNGVVDLADFSIMAYYWTG